MSGRLKFTAIILLTASLTAPLEAGQKSGDKGKRQERATAEETTRPRREEKTPPPLAAYLSGEAKITVRGDQNPVIRLGMARKGVTIVEFPASDRFFAVHPPELGDWVRVEKSPTRVTDHHLVLRAGGDLVQDDGPAQITVQMRSGLVITLWIQPVKYLTQQAHRCVVTYDREEIIAARKKAGLAVNLGENEAGEQAAPAIVADRGSAQANGKTIAEPPAPPSIRPPGADQAVAASDPPPEKKASSEELTMANILGPPLKQALAKAMEEPKQFKKWTRPLHGLSVSVSGTNWEINGMIKVALIAIHNNQGEAARVVPGHPEIFVETLNEKGKTLQITPVKKLATQTTTTDSVIPAGATVYYAVAYAAQSLGAKQHLRVAIGQTNAADEPITANLVAGGKDE